MRQPAGPFPYAQAHAGTGADAGVNTLPYAAIIVLATLLFNPVLAVINGHVMRLSDNSVILTEAFIVASALLVIAAGFRPRMMPWLLLIAVIVAFAIVRTLGTQVFEPKYLRDVLLIPIFVMLGMTTRPQRITPIVVAAAVIAVAVMLFEGLFLSAFREVFRVQDYYVFTRGVSSENFWDTEVGLYPSAVREDRLLPFVKLHRLSSIFLEPVTLGNFAAVLLAYVVACRRWMSGRTVTLLLVSTASLLVGCDGRLAVVGMLLILVVALVSPLLPPLSAIVFLPFTVLGVCLVVWIGDFNSNGNDFPGRLAHTVALLTDYGPLEYFGLSDAFASKAVDSGLAYLIYTQSALGLALIWVIIVAACRSDTLAQSRYLNAIALYICLTMLVSASFVSIKIAGIAWFILGSLQNDESDVDPIGRA